MTDPERIDAALTLLYECKWWNAKKCERAFAMMQDIFDGNQLGIIRRGYNTGLPRTHLEAFTYPFYGWHQMMIIENALHEIPLDKLHYLANPGFLPQQMQLIVKGITGGLSDEQLCFLAQRKHSLIEMKIILGAFENGVSPEDLTHFFYKKAIKQEY